MIKIFLILLIFINILQSGSSCKVCDEGYSLSSSLICVKNSIKTQEKITGNLLDGVSVVTNSLIAGSSVSFSFGMIARIIRNSRYLDLNGASLEVQQTFSSWKIDYSVLNAPGAWNSLSDGPPLPFVFERYGLEPAFLINYWKNIVIILAGLVAFGIAKLAEGICKGKKTRNIIKKVHIAASNFTLAWFYGSFDDVLLYSILEFRSTDWEDSTPFKVISFIISVLFLVFGVIVLGVHLLTIIKYQNLKKKQEESLNKFIRNSKNIKLFYRDFYDKTYWQQLCLLVHIIRSLLCSLIVGILFSSPIVQTLLFILINMATFMYFFIKKPFKKGYQAYGQYFCEIALIMINFSLLLLAILDPNDKNPIEIFGKVIIYTNLVLVYGGILFVASPLILLIYEKHQVRKKKNTLPNVSNLRRDQNSIIIDFGQRKVRMDESVNKDNSIIQGINLNESSMVMDSQKMFKLPSLTSSDSQIVRNQSFHGKRSGFKERQNSQRDLQKKMMRVKRSQLEGPVKMHAKREINKMNSLNRVENQVQRSKSFVSEAPTVKDNDKSSKGGESVRGGRESRFGRSQRLFRASDRDSVMTGIESVSYSESIPKKKDITDYEKFLMKWMQEGEKEYVLNWK